MTRRLGGRAENTALHVTTQLETADGRGWLLTIIDSVPRRGERGAWLHSADVGEMLYEKLAPVLTEDGCISSWCVKDGVPCLGVLYTFNPSSRRGRGRVRLVTIEVQAEAAEASS